MRIFKYNDTAKRIYMRIYKYNDRVMRIYTNNDTVMRIYTYNDTVTRILRTTIQLWEFTHTTAQLWEFLHITIYLWEFLRTTTLWSGPTERYSHLAQGLKKEYSSTSSAHLFYRWHAIRPNFSSFSYLRNWNRRCLTCTLKTVIQNVQDIYKQLKNSHDLSKRKTNMN